jgi:steroid delta-isomerase-like uncharacterized protein
MASGTTAGPLDMSTLTEFATRWHDAWNRHDAEAVAALCTEDVEVTDPASGTIRGRAAYVAFAGDLHRAFPDYRFEPTEPPYPSTDRPKAIVPWRMTATNTGPIEPPGFAPTGKPIVLEGVDHWWFRDGLVERVRGVYDLNGAMQQLGLAPMPGSRQEKALVMLQRAVARVHDQLR